MTNATTSAELPAPRNSTSSDEWLDLVDHVLLGLDHALNNRLGALRAFAELLRDEHWRTTTAATESVNKEVARLEETTSVVRLLARPRQASKTGLILEEVLTDVVRIQSMLYDVRDIPIDFVPGPPLEPVWSERSALIRLLSVVLYGIRRAVRTGTGAVRVFTDSDEEWVRIRLTSSEPMTGSVIGDYVTTTAAALEAEHRLGRDGLELRLPTLKAHRARRSSGADREPR